MDNFEVKKSEAQTPERLESSKGRTYSPRVDIFQHEGNTVILADMPGVDKDGLDIELEKNTLTIRGTVAEKPKYGSAVFAEYEEGSYERSFTLSGEIDREKIEANLKNGVLSITLPRIQPEPVRKIAVMAG